MSRLARVTAISLLVIASPSAAVADEWKQALIISPQVIQQGIADAHARASFVRRQSAAPPQPAKAASTRHRVLWTAIGAAGGFFGGLFLGAAIDDAVRDCECDDAGLKGAVIGGPIGAAAGGMTGYLLSK